MKPAIVTCSALLGVLLLTGAPSSDALAQTAPVMAPAPQAQAPQTVPAPAAPIAARQPTTQPAPAKLRGPPPPKVGERRRPTYASCNRLAHQRSLRGGARRRFLIRCRLGYERPRTPQPNLTQPSSPQPSLAQPTLPQSVPSQPAQPQPAPARQP